MSLTAEQIMEELADYRQLDELLCCTGFDSYGQVGCGCQGVTLREEIARRLAYRMMRETEYDEPLAECHTYNRMGGLDDRVLADIAHEYLVDPAELKRRFREE